MAFRPVKFDSGKVRDLLMGNAAVATKYGLMKMSGGYLVAAAAGDNEVEYIALEGKTGAASDGGSSCLVLPIDEVVEVEALCATTPVQATHVGTSVDLSDAVTLDLTATTDKVFHIDKIVNATNKLVSGHFNKPAIA